VLPGDITSGVPCIRGSLPELGNMQQSLVVLDRYEGSSRHYFAQVPVTIPKGVKNVNFEYIFVLEREGFTDWEDGSNRTGNIKDNYFYDSYRPSKPQHQNYQDYYRVYNMRRNEDHAFVVVLQELMADLLKPSCNTSIWLYQ